MKILQPAQYILIIESIFMVQQKSLMESYNIF